MSQSPPLGQHADRDNAAHIVPRALYQRPSTVFPPAPQNLPGTRGALGHRVSNPACPLCRACGASTQSHRTWLLRCRSPAPPWSRPGSSLFRPEYCAAMEGRGVRHTSRSKTFRQPLIYCLGKLGVFAYEDHDGRSLVLVVLCPLPAGPVPTLAEQFYGDIGSFSKWPRASGTLADYPSPSPSSSPIIQSRMLKRAALSAPVGSEIASCGILSNPDSIVSVAQMSTHEPSNQQVVDCQVV